MDVLHLCDNTAHGRDFLSLAAVIRSIFGPFFVSIAALEAKAEAKNKLHGRYHHCSRPVVAASGIASLFVHHCQRCSNDSLQVVGVTKAKIFGMVSQMARTVVQQWVQVRP